MAPCLRGTETNINNVYYIVTYNNLALICLQTVNITNHTKGKITCMWMKG